jgi:hypothetical protein
MCISGRLRLFMRNRVLRTEGPQTWPLTSACRTAVKSSGTRVYVELETLLAVLTERHLRLDAVKSGPQQAHTLHLRLLQWRTAQSKAERGDVSVLWRHLLACEAGVEEN